MTLGTQIALLRKQISITQEALARQLGVTNQAVSKWESDQCCPDVTLLPKIADIFGISIDALFGRSTPQTQGFSLPWENDYTLRAVLFVGHQYVGEHPVQKEILFCYEGPALNVASAFCVRCGDVDGNISAGSAVNCGDVDGSIHAGGNVNCGDVDGPVKAGGNVSCGDIAGDLTAGGKVNCGDIGGDLRSQSLH